MKHIVIIGAGPAGLTAAFELFVRVRRRSTRVTVLEEIDSHRRHFPHGAPQGQPHGHRRSPLFLAG